MLDIRGGMGLGEARGLEGILSDAGCYCYYLSCGGSWSSCCSCGVFIDKTTASRLSAFLRHFVSYHGLGLWASRVQRS